MFSVRIVTANHYIGPPIPDLDVEFSEFRNARVTRVPVLRIFGSTPAGQKTCLHVHGVFPYFYVPCDEKEVSDAFLQQLALSIDTALQVGAGNSGKHAQHVFKITPVSGRQLYGYRSTERQFLKIYFYNPSAIKRAADLLLTGAVLNRVFQPYESHVPFNLQFFIDYNLYGMNLVNLATVKFRKKQEEGGDILGHDAQTVRGPADESLMYNSVSTQHWSPSDIPGSQWLPDDVKRQSICELEVDGVATDILNRLDLKDNVDTNPGLVAIWEDERQRREQLNQISEMIPPSSPERGSIQPQESECDWLMRLREVVDEQLNELQGHIPTPESKPEQKDVLSPLPSQQTTNQPEDHLSQQTASQPREVEVEAVINEDLVMSQVTASQADDRDLAKLLMGLGEDDDSVLLTPATQEDDKDVADDPVALERKESLEMSQVWQQEEDEVETDANDSRDEMLIPELDETSALVESNGEMSVLPQLDGQNDPMPRKRKKSKLQMVKEFQAMKATHPMKHPAAAAPINYKHSTNHKDTQMKGALNDSPDFPVMKGLLTRPRQTARVHLPREKSTSDIDPFLAERGLPLDNHRNTAGQNSLQSHYEKALSGWPQNPSDLPQRTESSLPKMQKRPPKLAMLKGEKTPGGARILSPNTQSNTSSNLSVLAVTDRTSAGDQQNEDIEKCESVKLKHSNHSLKVDQIHKLGPLDRPQVAKVNGNWKMLTGNDVNLPSEEGPVVKKSVPKVKRLEFSTSKSILAGKPIYDVKGSSQVTCFSGASGFGTKLTTFDKDVPTVARGGKPKSKVKQSFEAALNSSDNSKPCSRTFSRRNSTGSSVVGNGQLASKKEQLPTGNVVIRASSPPNSNECMRKKQSPTGYNIGTTFSGLDSGKLVRNPPGNIHPKGPQERRLKKSQDGRVGALDSITPDKECQEKIIHLEDRRVKPIILRKKKPATVAKHKKPVLKMVRSNDVKKEENPSGKKTLNDGKIITYTSSGSSLDGVTTIVKKKKGKHAELNLALVRKDSYPVQGSSAESANSDTLFSDSLDGSDVHVEDATSKADIGQSPKFSKGKQDHHSKPSSQSVKCLPSNKDKHSGKSLPSHSSHSVKPARNTSGSEEGIVLPNDSCVSPVFGSSKLTAKKRGRPRKDKKAKTTSTDVVKRGPLRSLHCPPCSRDGISMEIVVVNGNAVAISKVSRGLFRKKTFKPPLRRVEVRLKKLTLDEINKHLRINSDFRKSGETHPAKATNSTAKKAELEENRTMCTDDSSGVVSQGTLTVDGSDLAVAGKDYILGQIAQHLDIYPEKSLTDPARSDERKEGGAREISEVADQKLIMVEGSKEKNNDDLVLIQDTTPTTDPKADTGSCITSDQGQVKEGETGNSAMKIVGGTASQEIGITGEDASEAAGEVGGKDMTTISRDGCSILENRIDNITENKVGETGSKVATDGRRTLGNIATDKSEEGSVDLREGRSKDSVHLSNPVGPVNISEQGDTGGGDVKSADSCIPVGGIMEIPESPEECPVTQELSNDVHEIPESPQDPVIMEDEATMTEIPDKSVVDQVSIRDVEQKGITDSPVRSNTPDRKEQDGESVKRAGECTETSPEVNVNQSSKETDVREVVDESSSQELIEEVGGNSGATSTVGLGIAHFDESEGNIKTSGSKAVKKQESPESRNDDMRGAKCKTVVEVFDRPEGKLSNGNSNVTMSDDAISREEAGTQVTPRHEQIPADSETLAVVAEMIEQSYPRSLDAGDGRIGGLATAPCADVVDNVGKTVKVNRISGALTQPRRADSGGPSKEKSAGVQMNTVEGDMLQHAVGGITSDKAGPNISKTTNGVPGKEEGQNMGICGAKVDAENEETHPKNDDGSLTTRTVEKPVVNNACSLLERKQAGDIPRPLEESENLVIDETSDTPEENPSTNVVVSTPGTVGLGTTSSDTKTTELVPPSECSSVGPALTSSERSGHSFDTSEAIDPGKSHKKKKKKEKEREHRKRLDKCAPVANNASSLLEGKLTGGIGQSLDDSRELVIDETSDSPGGISSTNGKVCQIGTVGLGTKDTKEKELISSSECPSMGLALAIPERSRNPSDTSSPNDSGRSHKKEEKKKKHKIMLGKCEPVVNNPSSLPERKLIRPFLDESRNLVIDERFDSPEDKSSTHGKVSQIGTVGLGTPSSHNKAKELVSSSECSSMKPAFTSPEESGHSLDTASPTEPGRSRKKKKKKKTHKIMVGKFEPVINNPSSLPEGIQGSRIGTVGLGITSSYSKPKELPPSSECPSIGSAFTSPEGSGKPLDSSSPTDPVRSHKKKKKKKKHKIMLGQCETVLNNPSSLPEGKLMRDIPLSLDESKNLVIVEASDSPEENSGTKFSKIETVGLGTTSSDSKPKELPPSSECSSMGPASTSPERSGNPLDISSPIDPVRSHKKKKKKKKKKHRMMVRKCEPVIHNPSSLPEGKLIRDILPFLNESKNPVIDERFDSPAEMSSTHGEVSKIKTVGLGTLSSDSTLKMLVISSECSSSGPAFPSPMRRDSGKIHKRKKKKHKRREEDSSIASAGSKLPDQDRKRKKEKREDKLHGECSKVRDSIADCKSEAEGAGENTSSDKAGSPQWEPIGIDTRVLEEGGSIHAKNKESTDQLVLTEGCTVDLTKFPVEALANMAKLNPKIILYRFKKSPKKDYPPRGKAVFEGLLELSPRKLFAKSDNSSATKVKNSSSTQHLNGRGEISVGTVQPNHMTTAVASPTIGDSSSQLQENNAVHVTGLKSNAASDPDSGTKTVVQEAPKEPTNSTCKSTEEYAMVIEEIANSPSPASSIGSGHSLSANCEMTQQKKYVSARRKRVHDYAMLAGVHQSYRRNRKGHTPRDGGSARDHDNDLSSISSQEQIDDSSESGSVFSGEDNKATDIRERKVSHSSFRTPIEEHGKGRITKGLRRKKNETNSSGSSVLVKSELKFLVNPPKIVKDSHFSGKRGRGRPRKHAKSKGEVSFAQGLAKTAEECLTDTTTIDILKGTPQLQSPARESDGQGPVHQATSNDPDVPSVDKDQDQKLVPENHSDIAMQSSEEGSSDKLASVTCDPGSMERSTGSGTGSPAPKEEEAVRGGELKATTNWRVQISSEMDKVVTKDSSVGDVCSSEGKKVTIPRETITSVFKSMASEISQAPIQQSESSNSLDTVGKTVEAKDKSSIPSSHRNDTPTRSPLRTLTVKGNTLPGLDDDELLTLGNSQASDKDVLWNLAYPSPVPNVPRSSPPRLWSPSKAVEQMEEADSTAELMRDATSADFKVTKGVEVVGKSVSDLFKELGSAIVKDADLPQKDNGPGLPVPVQNVHEDAIDENAVLPLAKQTRKEGVANCLQNSDENSNHKQDKDRNTDGSISSASAKCPSIVRGNTIDESREKGAVAGNLGDAPNVLVSESGGSLEAGNNPLNIDEQQEDSLIPSLLGSCPGVISEKMEEGSQSPKLCDVLSPENIVYAELEQKAIRSTSSQECKDINLDAEEKLVVDQHEVSKDQGLIPVVHHQRTSPGEMDLAVGAKEQTDIAIIAPENDARKHIIKDDQSTTNIATEVRVDSEHPKSGIEKLGRESENKPVTMDQKEATSVSPNVVNIASHGREEVDKYKRTGNSPVLDHQGTRSQIVDMQSSSFMVNSPGECARAAASISDLGEHFGQDVIREDSAETVDTVTNREEVTRDGQAMSVQENLGGNRMQRIQQPLEDKQGGETPRKNGLEQDLQTINSIPSRNSEENANDLCIPLERRGSLPFADGLSTDAGQTVDDSTVGRDLYAEIPVTVPTSLGEAVEYIYTLETQGDPHEQMWTIENNQPPMLDFDMMEHSQFHLSDSSEREVIGHYDMPGFGADSAISLLDSTASEKDSSDEIVMPEDEEAGKAGVKRKKKQKRDKSKEMKRQKVEKGHSSRKRKREKEPPEVSQNTDDGKSTLPPIRMVFRKVQKSTVNNSGVDSSEKNSSPEKDDLRKLQELQKVELHSSNRRKSPKKSKSKTSTSPKKNESSFKTSAKSKTSPKTKPRRRTKATKSTDTSTQGIPTDVRQETGTSQSQISANITDVTDVVLRAIPMSGHTPSPEPPVTAPYGRVDYIALARNMADPIPQQGAAHIRAHEGHPRSQPLSLGVHHDLSQQPLTNLFIGPGHRMLSQGGPVNRFAAHASLSQNVSAGAMVPFNMYGNPARPVSHMVPSPGGLPPYADIISQRFPNLSYGTDNFPTFPEFVRDVLTGQMPFPGAAHMHGNPQAPGRGSSSQPGMVFHHGLGGPNSHAVDPAHATTVNTMGAMLAGHPSVNVSAVSDRIPPQMLGPDPLVMRGQVGGHSTAMIDLRTTGQRETSTSQEISTSPSKRQRLNTMESDVVEALMNLSENPRKRAKWGNSSVTTPVVSSIESRDATTCQFGTVQSINEYQGGGIKMTDCERAGDGDRSKKAHGCGEDVRLESTAGQHEDVKPSAQHADVEPAMKREDNHAMDQNMVEKEADVVADPSGDNRSNTAVMHPDGERSQDGVIKGVASSGVDVAEQSTCAEKFFLQGSPGEEAVDNGRKNNGCSEETKDGTVNEQDGTSRGEDKNGIPGEHKVRTCADREKEELSGQAGNYDSNKGKGDTAIEQESGKYGGGSGGFSDINSKTSNLPLEGPCQSGESGLGDQVMMGTTQGTIKSHQPTGAFDQRENKDGPSEKDTGNPDPGPGRRRSDITRGPEKKNVFVPVIPPPTRAEIQASLGAHRLTEYVHRVPYWEKSSDVPAFTRETANMQVQLNFNLPVGLREAGTPLSATGLHHWRTLMFVSDQSEALVSQDGVFQSEEGKVVMRALLESATSKREVVLTPSKLPPTCREVKIWLQAEAEMVGKRHKGGRANDLHPPKSRLGQVGSKSGGETLKTELGAGEGNEELTPHDPKEGHRMDSAMEDKEDKAQPSSFLPDMIDRMETNTPRPFSPTSPPSEGTQGGAVDHRTPTVLHSTPVVQGGRQRPVAHPEGLTPILVTSARRTEGRLKRRVSLVDVPRSSVPKAATPGQSSMTTPLTKRGSFVSQLEGASLRNTCGFKYSQSNIQDAKALHENQNLTLMSLELHVHTRGKLRPDPEFDPIRAVFFCFASENYGEGIGEGSRTEHTGVIVVDNPNKNQIYDPASASSKPLMSSYGLPDVKVTNVENEQAMFDEVIRLVRKYDPDFLVGYEIQQFSWGYLLDRAAALDVKMCANISRLPDNDKESHFSSEKDAYGASHTSEVNIAGRVVLNIWRLIRHEIALNIYTFENVSYHVLHQRVPLFSLQDLSAWFDHQTHLLRWRVVEHYMYRVMGNLRILKQMDLIGRTSELARLFGIQFFSVLSRGTQYRVESMMLRQAKAQNFVAISPSVQQRAAMKAPECIALVMEPESRLYEDPVIVLDFQSLYPSMMIGYNYCFSTCLGRVEHIAKGGHYPLGCTTHYIPPKQIQKLLDSGSLHVSPNGVVFIKKDVQHGILPRMLEQILNTRIMVKKGLKDHKDDKVLRQMLDNRQLGLKLIANVTYGYTSASFSGRMPCIELGDSIVMKARETLERSIHLVETTPKWGARVVYGDTDSMFVMVKGASKERAFEVGREIVAAVSKVNPKPVKLKLEKVYKPCVLQAKKRYVGYKYETPDQKEPELEAKGIETIRRDSCPAVAKILEKALKITFTTQNLSQVKQYVQKQFQKIIDGRINLQDLVFAKEYRGRQTYKPGACVPALELTKRSLAVDKRAEPRVGERVPYVIVNGVPGLPLIQLVRRPEELTSDPSLILNSAYYITRQIIPALNRVFGIMGVETLQWYEELPRNVRVLATASNQANQGKKGTISQYFCSLNCVICDQLTKTGLCDDCRRQPQMVTAVLGRRIQDYQRAWVHLTKVCRSCTGFPEPEPSCISNDCPLQHQLTRTKRKMNSIPQLVQLIKEIQGT